MTAPKLAAQFRALADSLERASGLSPDDPDLLTLKRILTAKSCRPWNPKLPQT